MLVSRKCSQAARDVSGRKAAEWPEVRYNIDARHTDAIIKAPIIVSALRQRCDKVISETNSAQRATSV